MNVIRRYYYVNSEMKSILEVYFPTFVYFPIIAPTSATLTAGDRPAVLMADGDHINNFISSLINNKTRCLEDRRNL